MTLRRSRSQFAHPPPPAPPRGAICKRVGFRERFPTFRSKALDSPVSAPDADLTSWPALIPSWRSHWCRCRFSSVPYLAGRSGTVDRGDATRTPGGRDSQDRAVPALASRCVGEEPPGTGQDAGNEELTDDEWVTQHGTQRADGTFKFRSYLREDRDPPERSMSLIRGAHEPSDAGCICYRNHRPSSRDACRQAPVGTLRAAGFVVEFTPRGMSRLHVSVYLADGDWDDDAAARFDSCFALTKGGRGV